MPYIPQDRRDVLDQPIEQLLNALRQLESDHPTGSASGNVNYVFTTILTRVFSAQSYDDINTVLGVLECVKAEYYRRIAAPYESQKAFDNGDVF